MVVLEFVDKDHYAVNIIVVVTIQLAVTLVHMTINVGASIQMVLVIKLEANSIMVKGVVHVVVDKF